MTSRSESAIFLSYSSKDSHLVDLLEVGLRDAGIRAWRDVGKINVGDHFRESIGDAIRSSIALVLALSRHSVQSGEVRSEVYLAKEDRTPILPVYLEALHDPLPSGLRQVLAGIHDIKLYKDFDAGVDQLVQAIRGQDAAYEPGADQRSSFSSLQEMGGQAVLILAGEYETKLLGGKFDARTLVSLGRCYLYLGNYADARRCLHRATKEDPASPAAAYCLALGIIGGRRPRALTMREAEQIARLLQGAATLDPGSAHYDYLAAVVKIDYYEGHGLLVPPPSVGVLRMQATQKSLDRSELARMFDAVDIDGAVWKEASGGS